MKYRDKGFSTIELLVASAVIGIGIMVVVAMLGFVDKTLGKARTADTVDILTEKVRKVLSYGFVCKANLGGMAVNFNAPTSFPLPNNEIKTVDEAGVPSGAALSLTSPLDLGLTVSKIEATPRAMIGEGVDSVDGVSFQMGLVDVKINFLNRNNEPLLRSLLVRARIKAGVIDQCATELQPDSLVGEVLCALESGGTWAWDSTAGRCVDSGSYYYTTWGEHDSVSCHPGDKVSGGCDCQPPDGWVNPLPPLVYNFPDGTQTTQGQWPCNDAGSRTDPNSCETVYDSRIDSTGFVALAYCRKEAP